MTRIYTFCNRVQTVNAHRNSLAMSLNHKSSLIDRLLRRKSSEMDSSSQETVGYYPGPQNLPPVTLNGYKSTTKHKLISEELSSNIRDLIPPRLRLFNQWSLLYSSENDGYSLTTLYGKCNLSNQFNEYKRQLKRDQGYGDQVINRMIATNGYERENNRPIGYVMVIRDSKDNRFGCYLNENLRPMDHKRYYGNGECFLWKQEKVKGRQGTLRKPGKGMEKDKEGQGGKQKEGKEKKGQEKEGQEKEGKEEQNMEDLIELGQPKVSKEPTEPKEAEPTPKSKPDPVGAADPSDPANTTPTPQSLSKHRRFKAFMYTGINDNIIYSNNHFIAIGSSKGQNGLYINSNLTEGVSYRCETFGNEVLNGSGDLGDNHEKVGDFGVVGKFKILGIEIWRIGTLE